MKILITGATGFIGQNLTKLLVANGHEIHVLVREHSDVTSLETYDISLYRYSGNIESLLDYFHTEKFEGVIHLASLFLASHTPKDIEGLVMSNIQFGTELLEASKTVNLKWFINTGTFWQNYENESYNPVNLYGATKQAFENMARYYTETSDLIFTTLKLNDTFGPNDTRNKVFNLWEKIAQSGETLEMSAGEQLINISYIEDVVGAFNAMVQHLSSTRASEFKNKIYAVRSKETMSLKALAKVFEEATDTKLNIVWGTRAYREREVMIPWENGQTIPGWLQKFTLKEAIQKTMEQER